MNNFKAKSYFETVLISFCKGLDPAMAALFKDLYDPDITIWVGRGFFET